VIPEAIKEQIIERDTPTHNQPKKKETATDTLEVDLHAEALTDENKQYTPADILALQLSTFHAAIEEAISKKLRKLVIIHGLGQGTLKMQIRKELQEKYSKYTFQDASFKEYGFGATMVHLIVEKQQ
jgi:dsDNA-specific endonuclease/ATPase MutS2